MVAEAVARPTVNSEGRESPSASSGQASFHPTPQRTSLCHRHSKAGLAETRAMGVGLRPTGKPVESPPNPNAARAVFLPDRIQLFLRHD